MRPIAPRTGAPEVTIAEEQPDYSPLVGAVYANDVILTRWRMDDADRAKVAAGEDLYIALMTFGYPMQPLSVQVGGDGWLTSDSEETQPSREPPEPLESEGSEGDLLGEGEVGRG